jgi:DNA-binding beta-propeller fold protein YncE
VARPRHSLALALALLPALLAGCDDDDEGRREPAPPPPAAQRTPFPPTAAEPAAAPRLTARPPGRVVPVGNGPEGVVVDGETGLAAVGLREPDQLALVDARTGAIRRRVELPAAPRHLQLAGPGGPVLVSAEGADALVEVSLPGGEVRTTRVGDQPHDATALDGRRYVIDELASTISVVEGGRLARRVPVDVQPGGIVAVGERLAVISVQAYTVELFDPGLLRGGGSRNAGLGPTHVVADDRGRLYVTDTRGDAVVVFQTSPRLRWVQRVETPGSPYGIAHDDARDRLHVTLVGRNEIVSFDTDGDRPRRLRTQRTVRQPNTLAVDPRSGALVVASRTDGTLQLLR